MVSYHEHNMHERGEEICGRIENGESCALVTDAGMPAISDPGEILVRQCAERNIPVCSVPGPTALTTALAISGLPTGRFTFEGFLSVNKPGRNEHLLSLKNEQRTMIFYEAPHKLRATLGDLYRCFGDRRISIVRELTKVYESVTRTTLKNAAEMYSDSSKIRGEYVLIVEGMPKSEKKEMTLDEAARLAGELFKNGMPPTEAAKEAAEISGHKKAEIYKLIIFNKERL